MAEPKLARPTVPLLDSGIVTPLDSTLLPRVSFVLPVVAGKRAWAERSVERLLSARFQGLPRIEIVAVDDGTADEAGPYLKSVFPEAIRSGELHVVVRDRTGDLGRLKNEGAASAQARLLAFLHPDELWRAEMLAHALRSEQDWDLAFAFREPWDAQTPLNALVGKNHPVWKGSLLVRRELWERAGRFREGYTGYPLPKGVPGEAVYEFLIRALGPGTSRSQVLPANAGESWSQPGPPPIAELLLPLQKLDPWLQRISLLRSARAIPPGQWLRWAREFERITLRPRLETWIRSRLPGGKK